MNAQDLNEVYQKLTSRRKEVLRLILAGESDESIAQDLDIKPATVRKYLERLYEAFGISKRVELVTLFAKHKPELIDSDRISTALESSIGLQVEKQRRVTGSRKQDLGEAPDIVNFYGRIDELETLNKWIINDRCRVVALLGMGGLGKTALSVKLVKQLEDKYNRIIWRSLREAPKLEVILADIIKFLSNQQVTDLKGSINDKVMMLIDYLRSSRCLLILDNFESIFKDGAHAGLYRDEYRDYSILIQRVGELFHQSCLVITSTTKPQEIAVQSGENLPIRSLLLPGLEQKSALKILLDKGLNGSEKQMIELAELYSCNPLALKIVSTFIKDLFNGNITEFINQELTPFVEIKSLLDNQFHNLEPLEKSIMYWLGINREPVYVKDLFEDMLEKPRFDRLIESLENLKRRSLIETIDGKFTLQNVVMEYTTALLVGQVAEEIKSGKYQLFNTYALIQATAKDYIRDSQIQQILRPIAKSITDIDDQLLKPLKLKEKNIQKKGYAVGNILNLLCYFGKSLSGLDLSGLTIWQAYLRGANLRNVKFTNSDLNNSHLTEEFGTVLCVASSPTSSIWAMGDTKSKIRIRHPKGQQVLDLEGHTNWVRSIAFSPDGDTLISGSDDTTLMVWNTQTGQLLKTLSGHKQRVWSVAFSSDGKNIASGCEDKTVKLWNINTGKCWKTLDMHTSWVRSVTFSPDGKILASASSDRKVILWDVPNGQFLKVLEEHTACVRSLAFSPDGKTLASGGDDNRVILWDVLSGKDFKTLEGHSSSVRSLAFSPDGKTLASASEDKKIILWDARLWEQRVILSEHKARIWSVTFYGTDSKTLISSSDDKTVKTWDVNSGKCLKTLQGHTNWAWSIAFNPKGNILVSGNEDQSIKLWNIHNSQLSKTIRAHSNRIRTVAISPDGSTLASGSDDQTIKLWDIQTGECLKTLADHTGRVLAIAFSPDGYSLASGGDDQVVRIWHIRTGECRKTQSKHLSWVWSVAFSADSKILASASEDTTIKLWDLATLECIKTLEGHTTWVRSVTFSPDDKILVSGSEDATIKLWDISTGYCIKTLKGETGWIRSIAISRDSRFLACAGEHPIVEIWDLDTAEIYQTLSGHEQKIWSVTFSDDSKILASSSEDGAIALWDIQTGRLLNLLRAPRLYEAMDITGVVNLTQAQIKTLKTLGATKNDSW